MLSYGAAYSAFKKLLKFAGFKPQDYALHSARRGATSDAFRCNVPDHIIDLKGRWKCPNTKYSYLRVKPCEIVKSTACLNKYV